MKISICGKGGSGKSTVTTLLTKEFVRRNFNVIVVDSDESNTGLYKMLNLNLSPIPLMEMVGGKKSIQRKLRQAAGLQFLTNKITIDDIPNEFIEKNGKINFIAIGKILQSKEGCACPMGALTKEFLKKINLKNNEIAIVDMEAGIEHFGRGIDEYVDIVIIVIEPCYESINVALKIKELIKQLKKNKIFPVINYNRMVNENVKDNIEKIVRKNFKKVFSIPYDEKIASFGILNDKFLESENVKESVKKIADEILQV